MSKNKDRIRISEYVAKCYGSGTQGITKEAREKGKNWQQYFLDNP